MVYTFNLDNKVIILTGGYGFLGRAVAESLLLHGAEVYILGKDEVKFKDAFNNCETSITNLKFITCDISKTENIINAFQNVIERSGRIDVLINNAFYSIGQSPEYMSDEEWEIGIDGTLHSVFRCIRSIIPIFKERKKGKIINVSSMYGLVAPHFEIYEDFPAFLSPPHYGAAKAGVIQLTKYYSSYLGKYGIQVNAITPGPFPSEIVQESVGFVKALAQQTSLKKIGQPEDLAGTFVFLASDTSNFITGQNIIIDGGWTSK